jgi:hypothetical protein
MAGTKNTLILFQLLKNAVAHFRNERLIVCCKLTLWLLFSGLVRRMIAPFLNIAS